MGLLLGALLPLELAPATSGPANGWPAGRSSLQRLQPGAHFTELGLAELRQIRGVGPARARSIRQALWATDRGVSLEAIPGVGVKTAAAIEDWLAERGLPPGEPHSSDAGALNGEDRERSSPQDRRSE